MFAASKACRAAIFGLACIGFLMSVASAQTLEQLASSKSLRVGFIADEAPFSAKSPAGAPQGYAIDLCAAVAQELGKRIDGLSTLYSEVTIEDGFKAIADGRIDLLCGATTATLQRRETVDFSQPIFVSGVSILVRRNGPRALRDLAFGDRPGIGTRSYELTPFATLRLGVRGGTRTETLLTEAIARGGYKATKIVFPTHAEGLAALEAGSIDGYVADRGLLAAALDTARDSRALELGSRIFSHEPYAIALRRGDADLRLLVDRTLTGIFQTPQTPALLTRYFGAQADTIATQLRDLSLPE